jgi:transcriptional regulator
MYLPHAFEERNQARIHAMMREHSFATLVSQVEGAPFATHLPLLLDPNRGPHGTLLGHVARANPQWRSLEGQEVLVLFQGPHAYVSPAWYETELNVPTWNYVAVHAYGRARLIEAPDELFGLLQRLVHLYESDRPEPWVPDLPEEFLQARLAAIIGFELEITRLEGKFKLGQNRPEQDRLAAGRTLAESGDSQGAEVGELMISELRSKRLLA